MAITVPATGDQISATNFGKPVADQLNALVPTAWQYLTLQNGWQNFGSGRANCSCRRDGAIVTVRVAMKLGTSGLTCFNLPSGYRPAADMDFLIRCGPAIGFFNIVASGDCALFVAMTGDNTAVLGTAMFVTG
jgi:hypothetical protein